jgi:hypothetical protein
MRHTRAPSLIPSFVGSGVPEEPAISRPFYSTFTDALVP